MITRKLEINILPTGVPGLDQVLGGGLPEFSFNLIAGPPGSGKTTLAHQLMFALATPDRPAIYFTVLGESPLKMLRYQQQFDFFDAGQINRAIHFISLADDVARGDLDSVLARVSAEVGARAPGLVFMDSFRSVTLASEDVDPSVLRLQQFSQRLSVLMTSWQATTFLIGEYWDDNDPNPIFAVADGLIWLRQCAQGNSVVRKLEIAKMRGLATLPGLHTFRIGSNGINVFSPPPAESDRPTNPSAARARMGTPGLDEMMGGGLPQGYSLLVAGPSGSGKSILASAFLAEGVRNGEPGVIAAFEQRPNRSRGKELANLISAGKVGVIDARESALSVDEIAHMLIIEIHRMQAKRVVIDSLSGFELALAPTFHANFRESLFRMVSTLVSIGVSVLMTTELEDRFSELRFSPYDAAFMTDAIIVQRYIELDSRLQRLMAVVKVRGSEHSSDLRLYHIDADGIRIGETLVEHEGLLGGSPTRRISADGDGWDSAIEHVKPERVG